MFNRGLILLAILASSSARSAGNDEEYFYCEYFDNGYPEFVDRSKWGKGTDFKYNSNLGRWEWNSDSSLQLIFPDGRYQQIAKKPGVSNQTGRCGEDVRTEYERRIKEIIERSRRGNN